MCSNLNVGSVETTKTGTSLAAVVVDATAITLLVVDAIVESEVSFKPDDVSVGAFCAEDDTSPLEQLSATRQSVTNATI